MLTSLVFLEVVNGPIGSALLETKKVGQKAVFSLGECVQHFCVPCRTPLGLLGVRRWVGEHNLWGARWNNCISEGVGSMEGTTLSHPAFKVLFKPVSSLEIHPCLLTDLLLGLLLWYYTHTVVMCSIFMVQYLLRAGHVDFWASEGSSPAFHSYSKSHFCELQEIWSIFAEHLSAVNIYFEALYNFPLA